MDWFVGTIVATLMLIDEQAISLKTTSPATHTAFDFVCDVILKEVTPRRQLMTTLNTGSAEWTVFRVEKFCARLTHDVSAAYAHWNAREA
jgi:hypothetical protein